MSLSATRAIGEETLAIEARGLTRRYSSVVAVAGVDLTIRQGEFFALIGPSGCGKTTLLRLIAGLDFPDSGELKLGGVTATQTPAHQRPVNTVFQSYALFPHMDVWHNVAFGLRMKGVSREEIETRVQRMLRLVSVEELAQRRPAELSGGQKQRVALARAAVNEPKVLLLDEPLGALDLKLRRQLQVELHQLQKRLGITFVYVTHDQEEALVMSDRIALMNLGRIEQMGTGESLYEKPRTRFAAQFLGTCNLVEGPVTHTGAELGIQAPFGQVWAKTTDHPRAALGKPMTLAVRPEKVRLLEPGTAAESNAWPAEIMDVIYGGAETQYLLRLGDSTFRATLLNTRVGHQGFRSGDSVMVAIDPEAFILLEDQES